MNTPAPLDPSLRQTLTDGLHALALDPAGATPLLDYLALLLRWNRTYNLTAVRDPHEMVVKHLLDSLAMHPFVDDIAARGGAPGRPRHRAPACRASRWRSSSRACRSRWSKATARRRASCARRSASWACRARAWPNRASKRWTRRARYDAITARALATLPLILELGGHLLKPDGVLLAMKGVHPADEIAALPPGWTVQGAHPLRVPGLDAGPPPDRGSDARPS